MTSFKKILLFAMPLFVAGCGTLVDGQTQAITLSTPGATEATCTLDNGNRYRMAPGETIEIMRSGDDLVVDCYASGNRHLSQRVSSALNEWSAANVANGIVPGVALDRVTGGLYEYPSVIVVDFTTVTKKGYGLPDYHNLDAPNPYDQSIEAFGPSTPKIEQDNSYLKRGLEKRDSRQDANPFSGMSQSSSGNFAPTGEAKSSMTDIPVMTKSLPPVPKGASTEELNRAMNPGVFN